VILFRRRFRVHVMTDRRPSLLSLLVVAMIVIARDATAQATATNDSSRGACWTPRRPPLCRTIVVTEALAESRLEERGSRGRGVDKGLALTLGALRAVGAGNAIGVTGMLGLVPENDITHSRLELRYRHWTGRQGGVDLSAGFVHTAWRTYLAPPAPTDGGTAAIGWSNGLIGFDARVDVLKVGNRLETPVSAGVRVGARAFPFAGGIALLFGAVAGMMGGDT
jgi:hypothetical protein